jgi:hypothetical protein
MPPAAAESTSTAMMPQSSLAIVAVRVTLPPAAIVPPDRLLAPVAALTSSSNWRVPDVQVFVPFVPWHSAPATMFPLVVPATVTVADALSPKFATGVPNADAPVNDIELPMMTFDGFADVLTRTVFAPDACPVIP